MANILFRNFEEYVALVTAEEEEEDEETKDKKPKFQEIKDLVNKNGKKEDVIIATFLSKVFDTDRSKFEAHLTTYLELLYQEKFIKSKEFNKGLSRLGEMIPELALDFPDLDRDLWRFVIKPFKERGYIQYRFISWRLDPKEKPKQEEEDEMVFDTNVFIRLIAILLKDVKDNGHDSKKPGQIPWADVVKLYESGELKDWSAAVRARHFQIDSPEDFWASF